VTVKKSGSVADHSGGPATALHRFPSSARAHVGAGNLSRHVNRFMRSASRWQPRRRAA